MAVHYGRGTWIGIGEESTWGTAVSRTAWYRAVSVSGGKISDKGMVETLAEASGSWAFRRLYLRKTQVRLTIKLLVPFDGFGLIWKHAMFGAATTGAGPHTHTYEMSGPLPPGLTIEVLRGTAVNSEVYEGCSITRLTVSCVAGGQMEAEIELIGETSAARGAKGSPSVAGSEDMVRHNHAGTVSWNSRTLTLREFKFHLDLGLSERQQLGSTTISQPNPGAMVAPYIEAKLDSDSSYGDALYQDAHDFDAGDLTITFTSGAQSLAFILYNAQLMDSKDTDISSVDVIEHAVRWVGLSDGTDEAAAIVAVNASSSATAAP